MAGHAYRYEQDDDRKLGDREAPLAETGEPAGGAHGPNGHAAHSLAEIGAEYDAPGGEIADAAGPDIDQLSLHGMTPEPSQVDPVATAVAQTELERPGAPAAHEAAHDAGAHEDAHEDAHGMESGDADGPQAGAIQAPGGNGAEPAHDVPSSSVLSGAAQSLTTAVAETPAPGAAHKGPAHPLTQAEMHEMLDDPAPAPRTQGPRASAHPGRDARDARRSGPRRRRPRAPRIRSPRPRCTSCSTIRPLPPPPRAPRIRSPRPSCTSCSTIRPPAPAAPQGPPPRARASVHPGRVARAAR